MNDEIKELLKNEEVIYFISDLINEKNDYKSRIEKALHLITHSDITDYRVFDEDLLDILNGRSDE